MDAAFVRDVTIPDNTAIELGGKFVKTWELQNAGTCDWGDRARLKLVDGEKMGESESVVMPHTKAGESAHVSVEMTAPKQPGTYKSAWQMCTEAGERFRAIVYVQIVAHEVEPTSAPTSNPVPTIQAAVENALGTSNREVARVKEVAVDDGIVFVSWSINDNLTANWIKSGAQQDIVDILQAIDETGVEYERVDVLGSFSMRDKYGNVHESDVASVSYRRKTIEKINWHNFRTENVYIIADEVLVLHPEFRP